MKRISRKPAFPFDQTCLKSRPIGAALIPGPVAFRCFLITATLF